MIWVQLRPAPVPTLLTGNIPPPPPTAPVAVCCRIARIKVSSRVAISTFAEATRSVSCPVLAAKRNAAAVTLLASPITAIVRTSASPLSLLFCRKGVFIVIRSLEGCQENPFRCVEDRIRIRIRKLAAGQLPRRSRGKRSGDVVSQEKINAQVTADGFKREDRLTECAFGLSHPESNYVSGQCACSVRARCCSARGVDPILFNV